MTDNYQAYLQGVLPLKDNTRMVATGHQRGLFISGRPGTGKTWNVCETLRLNGVRPVVLHAPRLTPLGLFDLLHDNFDDTIFLDDAAVLWKKEDARALMLAAWGRDDVRVLTHKTARGTRRFAFHGALIAASNLPLGSDPIAAALADRVPVLEYNPSDAEMAGLIRHLVGKGHGEFTAEICNEVAEHVIAEFARLSQPLTVGYYDKRALANYDAWKKGIIKQHWREKITNDIAGENQLDTSQDVGDTPHERKLAKTIAYREIVGEILLRALEFPSLREQAAEFMRRTGRSEPTWWRALRDYRCHYQIQDDEIAFDSESDDSIAPEPLSRLDFKEPLPSLMQHESDLQRLRREMEDAIVREDYETAARIRDEIRQLEGEA